MPDAYQHVGEWEEKRGPLPLSIRAFFMIAAESLDLSPRTFPDGDNYAQPDSQLGYCDPLVVHELDGENTHWDTRYERREWYFAPDEYFKANVSGAGSLGWFLPDAGADARIIGQDDGTRDRPGEWFVDYLRHAFAGGAFRGYPAGEDGTKSPPAGAEIEHLRQGFLPV